MKIDPRVYKYVLFKVCTIKGDLREMYWTGEHRFRSGQKKQVPQQTATPLKARKFDNPREAYEVGDDFGMFEWRVGLRRILK